MQPCPRRLAFTLTELLVMIAIIMVLVSLLLSSVTLVRDAARSLQCSSNLRQIGMAAMVYPDENNGWMVPFNNGTVTNWGQGWRDLLVTYIETGARRLWSCPTGKLPFNFAKNARTGMYANSLPQSLSHKLITQVVNPSGTMLFTDGFERDTGFPCLEVFPGMPGGTMGIGLRHRGKANMLFVDGHVESRTRETADLNDGAGGWSAWFVSPLYLIEK